MKVNGFASHTIQDTLSEIERLAREYSHDVESLSGKSLKSFFDFVAKDIRYQKDPEGIEFVARPAYTIGRRAGDCDDKTVVCLAYFLLKEIPCGYSIVSSSPIKPYHHIFPFIIAGDNKIDYDATYPMNKIGPIRKWSKRKDYIFYTKGVAK